MKNVLLTPFLATDTTNFSVYCDYNHDDDCKTINITYGHPKDKSGPVLILYSIAE